MPSARFLRLPAAEQQRLLDVATDVFADHGYEATNLVTIAERLDMSKSTLYYYFDNKLDLFATAVQAWMREMLEMFGEVPTGIESSDAYWSEMESLFEQAMNSTLANEKGVRLGAQLAQLGLHSPEMQAIVAMAEEGAAWFESALTVGQRVGAVRTDLPRWFIVQLWFALETHYDLWMLEQVTEDPAVNLGALGALALDLFKRLVLPAGTPLPDLSTAGLPFPEGDASDV